MDENSETPALALSIQLSPYEPINTPAKIQPIILGTLNRLSNMGANNIIRSRIANIKIELVIGNVK